MGDIYSLLCNGGQAPGGYFDGLSVSEKSRYGDVGSYRCYASMPAWKAARESGTSENDTEILEIADAFDDLVSTGMTFTYAGFPCYKIIITTMVNGFRSAAFHGGLLSGGYCLKQSSGSYFQALYVNRSKVEIDGIRIHTVNIATEGIRTSNHAFIEVKNCIGIAELSWAFRFQCRASKIFNNIAYDSDYGFRFIAYGLTFSTVYNNLAIGCNYGFYADGTPLYGNYFNNVAYGCGVNWSAAPSAPDDGGMKYNAGEPGDSPWGTYAVAGVSALDFVNVAGGDFRLTATSALRDAGMGFNDGVPYDIIGVYRPNYTGLGDDEWDIGPFEFDSGGGLPPEDVSIVLQNIVSGSVVTLQDNDGIPIVGPTIAGESGVVSAVFTHSIDVPVVLRVRKASADPKYQPLEMYGVITRLGLSMFVAQIEDWVA